MAAKEISQDEIDKVKAEHPELDLRSLEALGEQVIVRPCSIGEYKKFKSMLLHDDKNIKAGAYEALMLDCCVLPDRAGYQQILARRPGLGDTFGRQVAAISGVLGDLEAKKV